MVVGGNIPDFAQGPLSMYAEQGDEGAELTPAGLQFTPLLEVFVLNALTVEELLSSNITVLYAEAALIHTPEGQSRHGVVETCGHLRTHIFPTGTDVAAPRGGAIALFTGKATTRQQEDALVGID